MTFQQARFVRQTLESVLGQRTDFAFEVIVGDDASTDGTREILEEIAAEHPDRVRLLLHQRNFGDCGLSNFMSTVEASRGAYLAFLDGDDYWTDPDKLQRQVDFLDAHPECALCAHRIEHLSDDGFRELSVRPPGGSGVHDVGWLIGDNFAHKISTVARREAVASVPEWYRTTRIASADWLFNVLLARTGRIGYLDEPMALHRKRVDNLSAFYGTRRLLSDKLDALETLRPYFPDQHRVLARAEQRVRLKLRLAQLGPHVYRLVQRWSVR